MGSVDCKHIIIEKPKENESLFCNYKGTYSVLLFAIVNANYEFIYVHQGFNGNMSNGEILKRTKFFEKLIDSDLELPASYVLPDTNISVPYVFLSDDTFSFDSDIIKPFPENNITKEERIFNYRLNRAKRVAENAFGILASRFGVFRQAINVENVDAIVMASCALHNFLRKKSKNYLTPACVDYEDVQEYTFRKGNWRESDPLMPSNQAESSEMDTDEGQRVRTTLMEYFNGVGKVDFQDKMVDIIT